MLHKKRIDNRGITLVEVIVSMLILAIILVPLLSSFVLSSRVNLKSRTKQYATVLGQNVMEGIKNYDLEEVALQFNGKVASGGAFSIVPETSLVDRRYGNGYCETNDSFHLLSVDALADQDMISIAKRDRSEGFYFKGNSEDTYYYLMKGVQEGTKRFDVRITISSKNYHRDVSGASPSAIKQNSFAIPDVTNLDVNETAIINPAGAGIQFKHDDTGYDLDNKNDTYTIDHNYSFDYAAIQYFLNEHRNFKMNDYLEKCTLQSPTPLPLTESSYYKSDELQKKVSKLTTITISDMESEGKNRILVTAKLEYKFRGGDDILYKTGATDTSNASKQFGGFYETVGFDTLHQIYLFHTPLTDGLWDSTLGDEIVIDNHSSYLGDDLKIFVAQQRIPNVADGGYNNIIPIRVKAIGDLTNKIKFYYNRDISGKPLESSAITFNLSRGTNYFETLVTNGAAKDRIYEVKVQVYEQGSTDLLNELSSTFTR